MDSKPYAHFHTFEMSNTGVVLHLREKSKQSQGKYHLEAN